MNWAAYDMARFADWSENELPFLLEDKDAENTKEQPRLLQPYFVVTFKKND